jgi:ribose/xylose/arabinose/galactoside ABC-type transport system permease subunit
LKTTGIGQIKILSKNGDRDILSILWTFMLLGFTIILLGAQFIASPRIIGSMATFYDYILKILISVVSVGLVAAPVTMVMISGDLDLSVGSIITLTTIMSCNISSWKYYDQNPTLCIILAIITPLLVGAACGAFNGFLVGKLGLSPFITTLGTMYLFATLAVAYHGGVYENGRASSELYAFFGRGRLLGLPNPIIFTIVSFIIFGFILHRTVGGRNVFAVGGNRKASKFSGISVSATILKNYVLSGLMAGFSGLFLASWTMSADMGVGKGKEFDVITAVILGGVSLTGGKGSMVGTLFGVLFMGVLRMFYIQFSVNPTLQFLIQGLILLVVVMLNNYVDSLREKRGA